MIDIVAVAELSAALSRGRDRQLRRLQGAQRLTLLRRARRDALHHRPERRRQDHHDGRHHRQNPARFRHRAFGGNIDLTRARRARNRQARHRPQVSEADGVREPHRVRESGTGAGRRRALFLRHCSPACARHAADANRRGPRNHRPHRRSATRRRRPSPRPEAMARNRHAADAEPASCCWWTSRWPA